MKRAVFVLIGVVCGFFRSGNGLSHGAPLDIFPLGTVGCLFTNQLCGIEEVCVDDLLFGSCQRVDRGQDHHKYQLSRPNLYALEKHILHLIKSGYTWRDPYTQCVLQNALLAYRNKENFDRSICGHSPYLNKKVSNEINDVLEKIFQDYYESYVPDSPEGLRNSNSKRDEIIQVHKYFDKEPQLQSKRQYFGDQNNNVKDTDFIDLRDIEDLQFYLDSLREKQHEDTQPYTGFPSSAVQGNVYSEDKPYWDDGGYNQGQSDTYQPTSSMDVSEEYLLWKDKMEALLNELKSGRILPADLTDNQINDLTVYINQKIPTPVEKYNKDYDWSKFDLPKEFENSPTEQLDGHANKNVPAPYSSVTTGDMDKEEKSMDSQQYTDREPSAKEINTAMEADMTDHEMSKKVLGFPVVGEIIEEKREDGSPTDDGPAAQEDQTKGKPIQTNYFYIQMAGKLSKEKAEELEMFLQRKLPVTLEDSKLNPEDGRISFRVNPNDKNFTMDQMKTDVENLKQAIKDELVLDIKDVGIGADPQNQVSLKPDDRYIVLSFVLCGCIAGILLAAVVIFLIRRHSRSKEKLAQLSAASGEGNEPSQDYQDLCRQRMQGKSSEKPEPLHAAARIGSVSEQVRSPSSRSSTSSWSEEPVASNMDISTGHIVLSYMEDHLKNKDRLDREWEGLCSYDADPSNTTVANDPSNVRKNRYSDTVPYDHSRVVLSNASNAASSDYINASTITDHDPRNPAYIATQGPLPHTVADFWQMIWEQGSVVIVMVTRLTENGEAMCYRYWPEEGSDLYHIYEVHLVSEHIWCEDYLVRSFYLKNLQTNETRTVTQFHFLTWPDLGVPKSIKALLDFRRKVNKSYRGRSCPIVVHCSDGCGRTGTYTLIDMVLNRMAKGAKEIDIAATLEHIRDQRQNMVKTKEQFQFALAAVAEEVHAILKALPQ